MHRSTKSQKVWAKALKEANVDMAESLRFGVAKNGESMVKFDIEGGNENVTGAEEKEIRTEENRSEDNVDGGDNGYPGRGKSEDGLSFTGRGMAGRGDSRSNPISLIELNKLIAEGTTTLSSFSVAETGDHAAFS